MSIVKRQMWHRKELFINGLKRPLMKTANAMKIGFTDEDFCMAFKLFYPELMDVAQEMCDNYKRRNISRRNKGYSTVSFPEPNDLILIVGRKYLNATRTDRECSSFDMDVFEKQREKFIKERNKKNIAYRKRLENNIERVQIISPKYVTDLIEIYFKIRKQNTLDINTRYLLLLEIAQFKSKKCIEFLHKVNACDKNRNIQHVAYDLLVQLGEHPLLARKRKGKQKESQIKCIDIEKNPTCLLNHIYNYQNLIHEKYDIFLSHSISDTSKLLKIKKALNKQNLVVYIDWVNDAIMMDRANQNGDTWNVLYKRMDESDKLLFVMSDNSLRSKSTLKEINYFKSLGKRIYVYQLENVTERIWPELNGALKCNFENGRFVFE